jgi:branched-chain amino acid transport system ATP-binding protein
LALEALRLRVKGVEVLRGISLEVHGGELVALVGPRGAGKTACLDCVSGLARPEGGAVRFDGREILGLGPAERAALGIARTFQDGGLFDDLTVLDNLRLGRHVHMRAGLLAGALYLGSAVREETAQREFLEHEIIHVLGLTHVRDRLAGTLSRELRARAELGRALAQEPRVLLLDAPLRGLHATEAARMVERVVEINWDERWQMACLAALDHWGTLADRAHRVVVLDGGEVVATGPPGRVQTDPRVEHAFSRERAEAQTPGR